MLSTPHPVPLAYRLVKELETKLQIVRRLATEGKHGRTRFISAEGCYSWVVANAPAMRVKFASKAFADWSDDREFYVVDGAVRKCPLPSLVWTPRPEDGDAGAPSTTTANENSAITAAAARAASDGSRVNSSECMPFGPRIQTHSLKLPGVQRPHGDARLVSIHSECSRWVEGRYRLCADLTEEESPFYNVVLSNGAYPPYHTALGGKGSPPLVTRAHPCPTALGALWQARGQRSDLPTTSRAGASRVHSFTSRCAISPDLPPSARPSLTVSGVCPLSTCSDGRASTNG